MLNARKNSEKGLWKRKVGKDRKKYLSAGKTEKITQIVRLLILSTM